MKVYFLKRGRTYVHFNNIRTAFKIARGWFWNVAYTATHGMFLVW